MIIKKRRKPFKPLPSWADRRNPQPGTARYDSGAIKCAECGLKHSKNFPGHERDPNEPYARLDDGGY